MVTEQLSLHRHPRILAGLPLDAQTRQGATTTVGGRPVTEVGLIKQRTLADVDLKTSWSIKVLRTCVPLSFCSDEYAGGSSYCHRFDEGADVYETVRKQLTRAEGYRPLAANRRERAGWHTSWSYMDWSMDTFNFLSAQYKHFVNEEFIVRRDWTVSIRATVSRSCVKMIKATRSKMVRLRTTSLSNAVLSSSLAGALAAQHFVKVLQQPDLGTYCWNEVRRVYERSTSESPDCEDSIESSMESAMTPSAISRAGSGEHGLLCLHQAGLCRSLDG